MSKPIEVSPPVQVTGISQFAAAATEAALTRRLELLEQSAMIVSVDNEEEECDAVDAASLLKALESGVEKSREDVKKPILNAGRALDAACREYIAPVAAERIRIEGLLTKRLIAKREEQAAILEMQRAEENERAAEAARVAEEAAAEHREATALAEAMNEPAPPPPEPVAVPVTVYAPAEPPAKVDGATFKEEYDFEVTDIHALYASNRMFVKLEVDRANLKAFLNMNGGDAPVNVPNGIRVIKTQKVRARAANTNKPVRITE